MTRRRLTKPETWVNGHPLLLPYIAFVTTLVAVVELLRVL